MEFGYQFKTSDVQRVSNIHAYFDTRNASSIVNLEMHNKLFLYSYLNDLKTAFHLCSKSTDVKLLTRTFEGMALIN